MNRYYFTFGQIHAHAILGAEDTLDRNCVGVIEASDYDEARKLAFEWFNGKFHHQYSQEQMDKQPEIMQYYPRGFIGVNCKT